MITDYYNKGHNCLVAGIFSIFSIFLFPMSVHGEESLGEINSWIRSLPETKRDVLVVFFEIEGNKLVAAKAPFRGRGLPFSMVHESKTDLLMTLNGGRQKKSRLFDLTLASGANLAIVRRGEKWVTVSFSNGNQNVQRLPEKALTTGNLGFNAIVVGTKGNRLLVRHDGSIKAGQAGFVVKGAVDRWLTPKDAKRQAAALVRTESVTQTHAIFSVVVKDDGTRLERLDKIVMVGDQK